MDYTEIGIVGKNLPQKRSDGSPILPRRGEYGEQYTIPILPELFALADEGSYFSACNATPGTDANYAVVAAFADTSAIFSIWNKSKINSVYPDYIRLVCGTPVPASATAAHYVIKTDNDDRITSGTRITGNNVNSIYNRKSEADVRFTPTVAAASGNARQISRGIVRSVIPVVNDEYIFAFGTLEKATSIDISGTTAKRIVVPVPPVVIGPGGFQMMLLHMWFPGNATTAGQFEYDVGWWER